jgi:DNA-binding CsgD family transcriptional regulator
MICTTVLYSDHAEARDAQRRLRRMYRFATNLRHCEACDGYHLIADTGRLKLPKKAVSVLRLLGLGFTVREIAADMRIPMDTVEWYKKTLCREFNAMNSNHLIAIAIAFGALSPNDFVPELTPLDERANHDAVRPQPHAAAKQTGRRLSQDVRAGAGKTPRRTIQRAASE